MSERNDHGADVVLHRAIEGVADHAHDLHRIAEVQEGLSDGTRGTGVRAGLLFRRITGCGDCSTISSRRS